MPPANMYQLKISIYESKPPIWRRVIVKPNMKLMCLHYLIQVLFEWRNCHLHCFQSKNQIVKNGNYNSDRDPYADSEDDNNHNICPHSYGGLDERKLIKEFLKKPKDKLKYVYDFGDNWVHFIELEKIVPKVKDTTYPLCVTGKRIAPIEDYGGTEEFNRLLRAFEDKNHKRHERVKEWIRKNLGVTDVSTLNFDKEKLNERIKDHMKLLS